MLLQEFLNQPKKYFSFKKIQGGQADRPHPHLPGGQRERDSSGGMALQGK